MKIITDIDKMKVYSRIMKKDNKSIGFVPTMGYLHEGHLSLIRNARKQNDRVIISIFVNPIQFGEGEDYKKYPRDIERDEELTKKEGVDVIFYPKNEDMYPANFSSYVDVKALSKSLCGKSRPGHFRGVTTVVMKLLEIIKPDIVYFGQKDAQQAIIINKMIEDLNLDPIVKILPIVREENGLAMSSRNTYLNREQRQDAAIIYKALKHAEGMFSQGERNSRKIINAVEKMIKGNKDIKTDYISIVDTKKLTDIDEIKKNALLALAVCIGKTRLIDNIILGDTSE